MNDRDFDITQVMHINIQGVSDSLHKLADQFDRDNANLDISWLSATSIELQRIGWNSLFVSTTIDTLVRGLSSNNVLLTKNDQTAAFRQVDGLHVAVKYLTQSIHTLKTNQADQADYQKTIDEALGQLADKILEVASECQRP